MHSSVRPVRWIAGLTIGLGIAVSVLGQRPACAAVPVQAQLSLKSSPYLIGVPGRPDTLSVGLSDPYTGLHRDSQGGLLVLKVRFQGGADFVDVSSDPNVTFFTDSALLDPPAILPVPTFYGAGSNRAFAPQVELAGTAVLLSGRYTDPQTGTSVTDSFKIQLRTLEAPNSFTPTGRNQALLQSHFRGFARGARVTLSQLLGPSGTYATLLAELAAIDQGIQQWWPNKVDQIDAIGYYLYSNLLKTNHDLILPLLRGLEQMTDECVQDGLLTKSPVPGGATIAAAGLAPWGEFQAFEIPVFNERIPTLWYGLAR